MEFKALDELRLLVRTLQTVNGNVVDSVAGQMLATVRKGGRIYTAGNGGSGNIAEHFVSDLIKGAGGPLNKKVLAYALNGNQVLVSAIANDMGNDQVFAKQLIMEHVDSDDLLICFSVSGTSPNIIEAIKLAKSVAMPVVLITSPEQVMQYPNTDKVTILHVETPQLESVSKEMRYGLAEGVFSCLAHVIPVRVRELVRTLEGS